MERLGNVVRRLVELHGGTLVLTGGRGSGKSQLVKELKRQGTKRKMTVFHVTKAQQGAKNILVDRHKIKDTTRFHVTKDVSACLCVCVRARVCVCV